MPGNEGDNVGKRHRIQRSAAATAGALVGVRLGPGGTLIGAAAGPYLEDLARKAWNEFRPDSQRRQAEMLGAAAEAAGQDPEALAGLIGRSEHTRLLTATAMIGAASTAWPPKVYALGRALADGLIADGDRINIADLVVPAMTDMERPHISLLELLVQWKPLELAQTMELLAYQDDPSHLAAWGWNAGGRIWNVRQIGRARPTLRPVLTSLIGTLGRHGLAAQNDNSPALLAKYSEAMRKESTRSRQQRSRRGDPLPPAIKTSTTSRIAPPPSWSPTELGERVLGYYHLAAGELGVSQASASGGG